MSADVCVRLNAGNVVVDGVWLWRADHDSQGLVYNKKNPLKTAIQINGDNVVTYRLSCEHATDGNLVEWNGNNGLS